MCITKTSLLDLDIRFRQKIKIVNFDPMDIVKLSNLFVETGNTLHKRSEIKKNSYEKAKYYRKWVRPLLTSEESWTKKRLVDDRHLIGMEIHDASKLYDFIHTLIRALKEIPTANADNIRKKLIAYNQLINDTIKICNQGI